MLKRHNEGKPRRGTSADLLVIGLGNPGPSYEGTRHNVGAEVVGLLAERHGGRMKLGKEKALIDELRIRSEGNQTKLVVVAFPQTFMNNSGESVSRLIRRYGVDDFANLVVVHDELDLPVGRLRVKAGGGLAGHNGLKSIVQHCGDDSFMRIRIGVGKPPGIQRGADFVLHRPAKSERAELDVVVAQAADAVEALVSEDVAAVMNRFN